MEKLVLKAGQRTQAGKEECKRLRREGVIPGIVYKGGKEGLKIQMNRKELWQALHTDAGENAIITLDISSEGKNLNKTVILQDMQIDPITDDFVHVDFHEISLKEKIKVKIPVVLKGEAIGVKEEEGVLAQVIWELEVECLPTEIPEHININVEELKMNESVHIKDIEVVAGVEIAGEPEQVLATVHPPTVEEEETTEEETTEEGVEPELIKKGKKEEDEADEASDGASEDKAE